MLAHVVILCLIVGGTALPFATAATLFYILTECICYSWDFWGGRSGKEVETNPGSNRVHTLLFFFFVTSLWLFFHQNIPLDLFVCFTTVFVQGSGPVVLESHPPSGVSS